MQNMCVQYVKRKLVISFLTLIFLTSCEINSDNVQGKYIKIHKDVKEILYLKNNNKYYREIYDLNNGQLLLKFSDFYLLDNDCINFSNFYTSFSSVELHKKYMNCDCFMDKCLCIKKIFFLNIYFEETEEGNVFAVYEKQ